MVNTTDGYARLDYYSEIVAADSRRKEFDIKNHSIIHSNLIPDFLFIGDSITHYWELNGYFNNPNQLVINRGIAGDTTTYLNKRFFVDALQLCPQYCILGIGINDSIGLEGDYWKLIPPIPYEKVLSTAKENISEIIQKAKGSSASLILTSLLPINMKISLHESERKLFVCELNQWLSKAARVNHLIFVDYYPAAAYPGTDKLLDGITYDGIHPNALGYEIMVNVLRNTLNQHNIAI